MTPNTVSSTDPPALFNTPLEAGLRAVVVLDAFAPRAFDLASLSLLDYYVVHSGDLDVSGDERPESLHPAVAARMGEYFVRRRLIEEGLAMMERAFIIERVADEDGLSFRACGVAAAMVDLMETNYNAHLRKTAHWIAHFAEQEGYDAFFDRLAQGVSRWAHEIERDPVL